MWTNKLLKQLSSVKFTIVLLILIVIASIFGTLIPQDWTEAQYKARYGNSYGLLKNLQILDVYHSYWYTVLLAIFCINLITCSTQNFFPLLKSLTRSGSTAGRTELNSLPFYKKLPLNVRRDDTGADEVIHRIRKVFTHSFYSLKYTDRERGIYYFERGKMGRLGPFITHASIIVILIGGIIVGRTGFREYRNVPVGKAIDVPHSNFQVRADDFKAEFYPNMRTPKEFTSVLTIIENGIPKHTETIEVNHPMNYKGIKFYQSSYGSSDSAEIELSKNMPDQSGSEVLGKFRIDAGQEIEVPNSQLKIKAVELIPDFIRDSSGQVGSRSREPNNPAILLELYEGNELKSKSWIFLKYPDFHGSGESEYSLKFLSTGYYTGLQISYDPGISVIWVGFLIMVVGMFMSFYLSYKRVWVSLSAGSLEMGGRSYRDRSGFEKEFGRLKASLDELNRKTN